MAAVPPQSGNKCKGQFADGSPNYNLYCYKGVDDQNDPIYTCATWRKFKVNCSKTNRLCSSLSSAYVAASTVCYQGLW